MIKLVYKKLLTLKKLSIHGELGRTVSALLLLVFVSVVYLVSIQAGEEPSKSQAQQKGFPDLINGLKAT